MKEREVGDKVAWVSQSKGIWTKKVGTVVQIIPANAFLYREINSMFLRAHYQLRFDYVSANPRKDTSYLVAVPSENIQARDLLYWPETRKLEDAHNAEPGTTTF